MAISYIKTYKRHKCEKKHGVGPLIRPNKFVKRSKYLCMKKISDSKKRTSNFFCKYVRPS